MTLQEIIEFDLRKAMRDDPAKRDLLRVVLSEATRMSKTVPDEKVIQTLKKMIENATECGNLQEIPILQSYLPLAMPESEIKEIVKGIIAENGFVITDTGKIMGKAKIALGSDFNGGIVAAAIQSVFKEF